MWQMIVDHIFRKLPNKFSKNVTSFAQKYYDCLVVLYWALREAAVFSGQQPKRMW